MQDDHVSDQERPTAETAAADAPPPRAGGAAGGGAEQTPVAGGDSPTGGPADAPAGDPTEGPADVRASGGDDLADPADPGDQPAPGTEDAGAAEVTADQFDALVAERDQFLDAYQRIAAEFDNFRKQVQKRIDDEVTRSQGAFVERLLPVLDAIEAARSHGSEDVETVASQLFGFLEKEGLEAVHPDGETFDPNVAEAVMHEPGDGEPVVVEVLRTGYLWQGRVLRAAMVKVAG